MIIGIVAESFWPRVNGVSNSVLRSAKFLKAQGHHVTILATGQKQTPEPLDVEVIRIASITVPSIHDYDLAITTKHQLEKIFKKKGFDLIHVASPFVLGEIALRAAKELNIPTVAVYQTDVTGFAKYYGYSSVSKFTDLWLSHIHNLATLNLVPSKWAMTKLEELNVKNLSIWGRGVDTNAFNPKNRDLSLRIKWNNRADIFVGYVGRLAPEKNIEDLKYIPDSPRIQVVVIGDGPSRYKLEEDMPNAIFTGRLTGDQLNQAYASLDVLIAPGRNETFCQVAQEGLAAGLCVVAPGQGATHELIIPNETGFIYDNASDEYFKDIFKEILTNPNLLNSFSKNARTSVEHNTWENVCQQLISHYYNALGNKLADVA